jgi:hypothetical protein
MGKLIAPGTINEQQRWMMLWTNYIIPNQPAPGEPTMLHAKGKRDAKSAHMWGHWARKSMDGIHKRWKRLKHAARRN